jgi:hypothetical protein
LERRVPRPSLSSAATIPHLDEVAPSMEGDPSPTASASEWPREPIGADVVVEENR